MTQTVRPGLVGTHMFHSRLFSNDWVLQDAAGTTIARIRRLPSIHVSNVVLADHGRLQLKPEGWGRVVAFGDQEAAQIERESWWGGRWRVSGKGFEYLMTSDHRPRRWTLRIGDHPMARLAGTSLSYNRVTLDTDFAVPIHAALLCWHVLARPWEAAATPKVLVPRRDTDAAEAL